MLPATTLRPARAFAVRVKPAMIATCSATAASFSTSTRPTKAQPANRSSFACKHVSPIRTRARCASTSTGAPTVGSTAPPSSASTQLTWNDFLALRKTRRKINVATSGVSAVAVTYAGLQAFISQGYDSTLSASVGLDPLMVTGLSTIGMIAVGWLLGPFFGNAIFNVRYRSIRGEIERKEREFYNRIKSHRVDPTSSSMANPVPDYYGEKIGSVADYRRWLKDQRAFNLKRGAYQGGK